MKSHALISALLFYSHLVPFLALMSNSKAKMSTMEMGLALKVLQY